jgi:outer membrane receptor protein involved in Fe transport
MQQEYLGGPIFIGNPELKMSALKNYDLRIDWTPYEGGLFSFSYFYKDIKDPIEYSQGVGNFGTFTYPVNYPEGKLSGYEFEVRQQMGRFFDSLEGLSMGANATFIDSEVTLPDDEAELLADMGFPIRTRDMLNAPEYLYNLYLTYDIKQTGTQVGLFYTVRGDTLVAGAGQSKSNPIPDLYELEYGTLNFSLSQKFWDAWKLRFQAKNLLDPEIETVYRSKYIGDDVTHTSYTKGVEFSISLSAEF